MKRIYDAGLCDCEYAWEHGAVLRAVAAERHKHEGGKLSCSSNVFFFHSCESKAKRLIAVCICQKELQCERNWGAMEREVCALAAIESSPAALSLVALCSPFPLVIALWPLAYVTPSTHSLLALLRAGLALFKPS